MSLQAFLLSVLNIAKNNAISAALPPIGAFLTSVGSNASAINFAAALTKLEVDLLAALPAMQQEDIKALTDLIQQEVAALAAQAEKPLSAEKSAEAEKSSEAEEEKK